MIILISTEVIIGHLILSPLITINIANKIYFYAGYLSAKTFGLGLINIVIYVSLLTLINQPYLLDQFMQTFKFDYSFQIYLITLISSSNQLFFIIFLLFSGLLRVRRSVPILLVESFLVIMIAIITFINGMISLNHLSLLIVLLYFLVLLIAISCGYYTPRLIKEAVKPNAI